MRSCMEDAIVDVECFVPANVFYLPYGYPVALNIRFNRYENFCNQ